MKTTAASIIKKSPLNLIYDSKHPGQGRKNLLDTLAELGIDTGSFVAVFTLDKTQRQTYEADIQKVANAVRDGEIEVKCPAALRPRCCEDEISATTSRLRCAPTAASTAISRFTRPASTPAQGHPTA
jgi:hypothetical protein